MLRFSLVAAVSVWAGAGVADVPRVATDIAPVHSLVSQVMEGVGAPDLILRPGASPHDYALRPSEARALQSADIVVWVGEALTPWMSKPLESLSPDAQKLELMEVEGTVLHDFRDLSEQEEEHGREEDHHEHDEHTDAHGHDHEGADPHVWLDPANARVWLTHIADALSELDPDNAPLYRKNAQAARDRLAGLEGDLAKRLSAMQGVGYISFHDAYQYFEKRFALEPVGTISLSDASTPGPARLAALRDRVAGSGVRCAFSEPQFDTRLFQAAIDGEPVKTYELDPLGVGLEPGAGLYPALLEKMAASFEACAKGE
ncbi:hypothetical protein AVO45_12595 [Ruegeria marisrubri]|uniref:High-affinity zinc uptake system protein ZnuA n=1 Tax=Ruegeria marisrubri TaxID=1685379 RepID=A0A0X3TSC0_9RHOB|nr:zinc ABC transporter substrate-binding protein [Ruegeria marisrubri]KUJ76150.1 hypothetical protein AVO45_12595 [Ruegeria marisrubri]